MKYFICSLFLVLPNFRPLAIFFLSPCIRQQFLNIEGLRYKKKKKKLCGDKFGNIRKSQTLAKCWGVLNQATYFWISISSKHIKKNLRFHCYNSIFQCFESYVCCCQIELLIQFFQIFIADFKRKNIFGGNFWGWENSQRNIYDVSIHSWRQNSILT